MTRNRQSAKTAGTRFAQSVAMYLADVLDDDRVERRDKNGAKDRGDITGVKHMGGRVVVECKDYGGRFLVGPWLTETEVERGNDDALVGIVVAKRRRVARPDEQVVFMTLADLGALLTGTRGGVA